jgi:hypothetical protein
VVRGKARGKREKETFKDGYVSSSEKETGPSRRQDGLAGICLPGLEALARGFRNGKGIGNQGRRGTVPQSPDTHCAAGATNPRDHPQAREQEYLSRTCLGKKGDHPTITDFAIEHFLYLSLRFLLSP